MALEPLLIALLIFMIIILFKLIRLEQLFHHHHQHLHQQIRELTHLLQTTHSHNKVLESPVSTPSQPEFTPPISPSLIAVHPAPVPTLSPPQNIPSHSPFPKTNSPEKNIIFPLFKSAQEGLNALWNWIIVGEEHRSKEINIEYAIATTWLLRFGVIAILLAMGYFLNYSIHKGYFVPLIRVLIGCTVGLSMLFGGFYLLKSKYQLIGQGLMGGGLAVFYFTLYAANLVYHLISLPNTFLLMTIVAVVTISLAIRIDSLLLAIFALIGGYTSPLILWAGEPNLTILYSYLLILGINILIIAYYKQWRLLNYLAFIFNYLLLSGSLLNYQISDFFLVITFLTLFFILHSSLVYSHNIIQNKKSTLLEIAQLIINAIIYSSIAYALIDQYYASKPYTSFLSLFLSGFYALHAYLFLKHRPIDRNLIIALIALTGFYITWSMLLTFEKELLTFSWSLQAFIFLWLGLKLNSNFIKKLAYLLYLVIFWRLSYFEIPRHFDLYPHPTHLTDYLYQLAERIWVFGASIAAIIGAFFLTNKALDRFKTLAIDPQNDTPLTLASHFLEGAFYWAGLLFLFLYLNLEFNALFSHYAPLRLPMLTVLWSGMTLYFLHRFLLTNNQLMLKVLTTLLLSIFIKILTLDILSWGLSTHLSYTIDDNTPMALIRLFDFTIVLILFYLSWNYLKTSLLLSILLSFMNLALIFVYFSLEISHFLYWRIPEFQFGGISILWAIFAIIYLIIGIWKNNQSLRYTGLILFAIVINKIILIDLAQMATLYRTIAFLLIGIILVIASVVYINSRQKFEKTI